jgi:hypothetical protein
LSVVAVDYLRPHNGGAVSLPGSVVLGPALQVLWVIRRGLSTLQFQSLSGPTSLSGSFALPSETQPTANTASNRSGARLQPICYQLSGSEVRRIHRPFVVIKNPNAAKKDYALPLYPLCITATPPQPAFFLH